MDIGTFLRLKRQEKELTQRDVAEAVGVSEGTISRWESGKIGNMRRDKIASLAKVLSIDPVIITKYKYDSDTKSNVAGAVTAGLAVGAVGAAAAGAGVTAAPVAAALAGLAAAAKALSTLVATTPAETPPDATLMQSVWDEKESRLLEEYRALPDSDKQTIEFMIRSLKEKNTVATSDGTSEEA